MNPMPPPTNQRILTLCLFLIIASLGAAISACKTGANGKPEVDYEKASTAIFATADAYHAAQARGVPPSAAKSAAISAGLTTLKTEPAPIELPVTEVTASK